MMLRRGEIIDRYQLEAPLGVGAFGEVWRASQLAHGEPVGVTCAIKVLKLSSDRFVSSPRAFANGWLDEVRNLVRVAGDAVPRVIEADIWNEHAYIAMELLDGITLRARLADGPIPWRRAVFIAGQIARALEAAHELGVIHRDLKPHNVMLASPNRVCVVDWGIARMSTATAVPAVDVVRRPAGDEATDSRPAIPLAPGHLHGAVGTTGYVAPEVYEGAPPAPEQDIYALGVVLYEMLAGCLPHAVPAIQRNAATIDSLRAFRASLERATMDHAMVPLRERCPGAPAAVAELVDSLLARDPAQRPRQPRPAIARVNQFPHGVPDPPYTGLGTLGPRHAGLYFGQQEAIKHVLERLESQRAALLWGPSGSGKSSLALAGVAATMDRTLFLDMDGWDIHVVRPREGQRVRVAPGAASTSEPRIGHVVIVDQLEEIVDLEVSGRDALCAAVLALLDGTAPVLVHDTVIGRADPVRVIATIRDDLEWRVDREVPALRPLLDRRIIVTGVDPNCARQIIEEPARAFGYKVEDIAAVSREVEVRLSLERAKLPMIQFALSEWWERRDRSRKLLPAAAWRETGGVDGALSSVAEAFYLVLDPAAQERLKALFVRLLPGGRKQPVLEATLDAGDRALVEDLLRLRIIGRRDEEGREPSYEAEHELLSENWPRLVDWLAAARSDRVLIDELERDAAAYTCTPDRDRLWRKRRLSAAAEMLESTRCMVTPAAQRFLQHAHRQEQRGRLAWRLVVVLAVLIGAFYIWKLNDATSLAEDKLSRARSSLDEANRDAERARSTAADADRKVDDANRVLQVKQQQLTATAATLEDMERRLMTVTTQEAATAQRQRDTHRDLMLEQAKVQDLEAQAGRLQSEAVRAEQRTATADARMRAAEDRQQHANASARAASDAEATARVHAADAEYRAKSAEVRALEAERRESKVVEQLRLYEAEARWFRTRTQYACVR